MLTIFIKTESSELWLIILYIGNLEPQKTFLQYSSVGHFKKKRLGCTFMPEAREVCAAGDIPRALPCAGVYLLKSYALLFLWFYIGSCFCEKTSICQDNTFVTLIRYYPDDGNYKQLNVFMTVDALGSSQIRHIYLKLLRGFPVSFPIILTSMLRIFSEQYC